jgi:hypothetical protein
MFPTKGSTDDLDSALAAIKGSNNLLMKSIRARNQKALESGVRKLRANRSKLTAAVRRFSTIR